MKPIGERKRRFGFFLNPYSDLRLTRCPKCDEKTRQRELPLVIHVDPGTIISLNKTCRYCPDCDLLIAHKDELEALLTAYFTQANPEMIGHDFLVLGTIDRPDWRSGVEDALSPKETLDRLYPFREVLQFKPVGGWVRKDKRD